MPAVTKKQNANDARAQCSGGTLRLLLGFAVGGLLGDVFLHLLPESVEILKNTGGYTDDESALRASGIWTLVGLFTFVLVELLFAAHQRLQEEYELGEDKKDDDHAIHSNGKVDVYGNNVNKNNSRLNGNGSVPSNKTRPRNDSSDLIHVSGYLNLIANSIDNFSHGLAVAGSFLAGIRVGLITTFAILLHEIPHEVGDFAILLKSGFSRWQAARAQLSTAAVGVFGAIAALSVERVESLGSCTSWILPFTAGGFINIALIGVLPELLKERNPGESLKQFVCVFLGVALMAALQLLMH
ncbi:zinc transporter ZIP13 homolog isoform X2 [Varroa jacobsoni]|uniref:Zinc transporter ZIP13 n=1 Tax=Varroa destructor TaxID=109461 RepID=A0A7M7KTC7_VARDE|nr:zinc transporter ZIP13 homolog isoform X2 [Varroa destructor]XP_022697189.1 zinc transporter ZIP13 homolog isoform X2 [Varroa jacobsoni]